MARIHLSRNELSFAILIESHDVASQVMFNSLLRAVKTCNPNDWKETICACFSAGVGRYVNERLENHLPLRDFYAVCRIFNCRINDVANFCGGQLLNPYEKEKLCLQVQGVETARHWTFHGERLSPREVQSSIRLLKEIVTSLSCVDSTTQTSQALSELESYAEALSNNNKEAIYTLPRCTVGRALLCIGLDELNGNFSSFLERKSTAQDENNVSVDVIGRGIEEPFKSDFPSLLKRIKAASTGIKKVPLFPRDGMTASKRVDCSVMCKNILSGRNSLAHNVPLTLSKIRDLLTDICNLFSTFCLSCVDTVSALQRLKGLDITEEMCVCFLQPECSEKEASSHLTGECRERILRPRGQHFVGRVEELLSITNIISDQTSQRNCRAVLVYGPAGIGKSYLVTEVVHRMSKIYKRQAWLSCSNHRELEQDLLCHHLFFNDNAISSEQDGHEVRNCRGFSPVGLVVMDNLGLSAVDLVRQVIFENQNSIIITTRSTAVKYFLERTMKFLHVVTLKPFSTAESLNLVKAKTKMFDAGSCSQAVLTMVTSALEGILGNLPLCINIFSSFLFVHMKKNPNVYNQYLKGSLPFDKSSLAVNWRSIEGQFGDFLHVRGLTGVLDLAESYLQDHPLVVYVLAKICSTGAEVFPWDCLARPICQSQVLHLPCVGKACSARLAYFVSSLCGVNDWLFSKGGLNTLEVCRDALEELGLITWDNASSVVYIHTLTCQCVCELLDNRTLFLSSLVDASTSELVDLLADEFSRKLVSKYFSSLLLTDVLRQGVELLENAAETLSLEGLLEKRLAIFAFLSNFLDKKTLKSNGLCAAMADDQYHLLCGSIASSLSKFSVVFDMETSVEDHLYWWKIEVMSSPSSRDDNIMLYGDHFIATETAMTILEGTLLYTKGFMEKAEVFLEKAKTLANSMSEKNSSVSALLYCLIADAHELDREPSTRHRYLAKASQTCSQLVSHPTMSDVMFALSQLLGTEYDFDKYYSLDNMDTQTQSAAWELLVCFRVTDSLEKDGEVDAETAELALLLILFFHQRQERILEQVVQDKKFPLLHKGKQNDFYCELIDEALNEVNLWNSWQKSGRALRALMKIYGVIDQHTLKKANIVHNSWAVSKLWKRRNYLVQWCCHNAWLSSHFSLGPTILRQFIDHFDNGFTSATVHQDQKHQSEECTDELLFMNADVGQREKLLKLSQIVLTLSEGLQSFYVQKQFRGSLDHLMTFLKEYLSNSEDAMVGVLHVFVRVALNHVKCLCVVLSESERLDLYNILTAFSQSKHAPQTWRGELQETAVHINMLEDASDLVSLCGIFADSMNNMASKDYASAHTFSLQCWRQLLTIREMLQLCEDLESDIFEPLFHVIFVELAMNLGEIYCLEGDDETAEWFLEFRLDYAQEANWPFLAAKFGLDYVKFLTERNRLSEAVRQCHAVQFWLEEEFGYDYQQWLPGMPRADLVLRDLEVGTKLSSCELF